MSTTISLPTIPSQQTPTGNIDFDVQLQPMDLYRAERTIVWRQVRPFTAVAVGFVLLRALLAGSGLLLVVIGGIAFFCVIVHSAFLYLGARSTLRTNRVLSVPMHYSLTPNGMATSTPTFWSDHSWGNLHQVIETSSLFILRSSSAQKNVIPKRCLAHGQLEKIRALVRPSVSRNSPLLDKRAITSSAPLNIKVRMTTEDLYWGFVAMLLQKSYWYAGQLLFSLVFIFLLNPQFISPVAFVVVGAIFFLYLAVFLHRASARAVRTNVAYQSDIEYAFGESGLEAAGPTFSFHHDWGNFQGIVETSRIFLFCPSNSQMIVIPKSSFPDISKVQALRVILQKYYRGKLSLKQ